MTPPASCETEAPSLMEPTRAARVVALPIPRRAVFRRGLCSLVAVRAGLTSDSCCGLHRMVPPDPAPVRGADHSRGGSTSNRGNEGDFGGGGEEGRGRDGGRRAVTGGVLVPGTGNDDKVVVLLLLGDGERRGRVGGDAGAEHGDLTSLPCAWRASRRLLLVGGCKTVTP